VTATRYRCGACGNITRFDVVATRRTRSFHHYTIGGDLEIEDEEVLDEEIERVTCRWCNATGDTVEIETTEQTDTTEPNGTPEPTSTPET
jgi:RNase P subunit RPR2